MIAKATVAAVVAFSFVAAAALPATAQEAKEDPTYFDLGIDVTLLPKDPAGAKKFLASQPPETQRVLLASCDRYVKFPMSAEMPETIQFCKAVLAK
jgi:hypothetical protein